MHSHNLGTNPSDDQEIHHFLLKSYSPPQASSMQSQTKTQEFNYRPKIGHLLTQSQFMPISPAQVHRMVNNFFKFAARISEASRSNASGLCTFPAMLKGANALSGPTVTPQIASTRYCKNEEGTRSKFRAESAWFCPEREKCGYSKPFKSYRYAMEHLTAVHLKVRSH